jgi:phosphatidylinositol glycan class N
MGGSIARLLLLGVAFHVLCIFSVLDVYFQSTVENAIRSANYTSSAPAKRVIIFTLDGCRVDKLFKAVATYPDRYNLEAGPVLADDTKDAALKNSDGHAPFLGDVMRRRGCWGVSHNHAPTESRPCHVALTAGMYEDPQAVSTSWKRHPLPFDSVFNQSSSAFIFGNKDVAPMLARHAPQATEEHYTAREEVDMVREDTTLLDVWAFRKIKELFARGTEVEDPELHARLHQDKLVIYCHFLGTDLTGPKFGAGSSEYLENIAVVDELIEKAETMIEEYFGHDGRTAYVVTADHGMDLRGDHGDDAPAKTRTGIVVWGAGVEGPIPTNETENKGFDIELPTQSRAELHARLETQELEEQVATREWKSVLGFKRKDVMQADVAPLISALAGLPYPRNSIGVLPFTYLAKSKYRANALRANAQQLYQHALRKEEVKRAHRGLLFIPYSPLHYRAPDLEAHLDEAINSISEVKHHAIHDDAHRVVELLSQEMIDLCRSAIVYYQTYDWFFLLGSVALGYVGWSLVMTVAYLHPKKFGVRWLLTDTIGIKFTAAGAAMVWWRFLADSPPAFYMYGLCPLIFWTFAWSHRAQLQAICPHGRGSGWLELASIVLCLELVLLGYHHRVVLSFLFILLALRPRIAMGKLLQSKGAVQSKKRLQWRRLKSPSFCWSASCLLVAVFPCLPSEYPEKIPLVQVGGVLALAVAVAVTRSMSAAYEQASRWKVVLKFGGPPVLLALATLQWTSSALNSNTALPFQLAVANWVLAIAPPIGLLIQTKCQNSATGLRSLKLGVEGDLEDQQPGGEVTRLLAVRLIKVMLGFVPAFVLLSSSYEVLFYVALCGALVSWLMLEAKQTFTGGVSIAREVQRALMLLVFVQVSFFGKSSVTSMTSFQMPSTRRFLPGSDPSVAQALVAAKLLIPFVVVACAFRLVLLLPSGAVSTREREMRGKPVRVSRYFLLAVALADMLAVQHLFLVNHDGSWKQMGNSIAVFCIFNAQIVLLPTIVFLSGAFVHDLDAVDKGYEAVHEDEDEKDS